MKRIALQVVPVIALLGACAPPTIYHKTGTAPAQVEAARTRCDVAALRAVPRDIRTRYIPATYLPSRRCTAHGRCFTHYLRVSPARHERYDANAALRARAADQCMIEAGFAPVRLPACDPATIAAPPEGAPQPGLGETSCARRTGPGEWRIVTPGE